MYAGSCSSQSCRPVYYDLLGNGQVCKLRCQKIDHYRNHHRPPASFMVPHSPDPLQAIAAASEREGGREKELRREGGKPLLAYAEGVGPYSICEIDHCPAFGPCSTWDHMTPISLLRV